MAIAKKKPLALASIESAPDSIRDQLRKSIFDGEIASGTMLKQDELAEQFGTSRIPVREALRQLETEGLITLRPNKGAIVTSLSIEDVIEMMEIRIALECHALRLSIPHMIKSDFDTAAGILRFYEKETKPEKWGDLNWRFHETLYAPCNMPKLLAMIEQNYGHVGRFVRTQVSRAAGKTQPQKEHWDILEACKTADQGRAVKLLNEHISYTKKSLIAATRANSRR